MPSNDFADKSRLGAVFFFAQLFLLAIIPAIVYYPGLHSEFQYDDIGLIRDNQYIRVNDLAPGHLLRAAFQDYRNSRPLANLSFALNYYTGRLDPFDYHLTNLLILILSALGINLLLLKLFSRLGYVGARAELAAWMAALIWALHPVNTQAITYTIQRYTSLSGMFCIWSLWFFHLGAERKKGRAFYIVSVLFLAMGLLSKETALSMPIIIFAYKLFFFDRIEAGWIRRNWKWFAGLMIFYACIFIFVLRPVMFDKIFDFHRFSFSAYDRLLTEPKVLLWYPLIVLFPFPQFQNVVHEFAVLTSLFYPASTIIYLLGFVALIFWALHISRKHKIISFTIIWFYGNLAVEALPLPIDLANEHRLYLACLGLICPLVAWPILRSVKISRTLLPLFLIAAFLGWFTWQRNEVWRTPESLWRDCVSKSPKSSLAWYNYCSGLPLDQKCRQVIPVCSRALSFFPNSSRVENNIGYCFFQLGRLEEAERHLIASAAYASGTAASGQGGNSQEEMEDRSAAFFNLGGLYMRKGNYEVASRFYLASLKIYPSDPQAHYNLARAYLALGEEDAYLQELQAALAIRPGWDKVRIELALALAGKNRCDQAYALIKDLEHKGDDYRKIDLECKGGKENAAK